MNKTKIEWADYTWNPITGCWGPGGTAETPNRCPYCYAAKFAGRWWGRDSAGRLRSDPFAPEFHIDRLRQPSLVKKPSKIFVCSMADMFGDWVPEVWILRIMVEVVRCCPQHTFMFLTKNPKRLKDFRFYDNCWVGTTITNQADADERIPELLKVATAPVRFVSHEPLQGKIELSKVLCRDGHGIDWAIIGAQTGPRAVTPAPAWVQRLIDQCRAAGVPVFLKDNLNWPENIQEWPEKYLTLGRPYPISIGSALNKWT